MDTDVGREYERVSKSGAAAESKIEGERRELN